jgi:hypothetical protein
VKSPLWWLDNNKRERDGLSLLLNSQACKHLRNGSLMVGGVRPLTAVGLNPMEYARTDIRLGCSGSGMIKLPVAH